MSIETRLKVLEKFAPAAKRRTEGMSLDDFLAPMFAALRSNPYNDSRPWLEELTPHELVQFLAALDDATAARGGEPDGQRARRGRDADAQEVQTRKEIGP